jgi:hypothetical protein
MHVCPAVNGNVLERCLYGRAFYKLLIILLFVALIIWVSITHCQWARPLTPDYKTQNTYKHIFFSWFL